MKKQFCILAFAAITLLSLAATPLPECATTKPESAKVKKQQAPGFAFFRTHRQGKNGITASWDMTSTTGVESFIVVRTYQDPYDPYSDWETVSNLLPNSSHGYKYTDVNVLPGFINYCIIAVMTDGSRVISDISTVRILRHG